MKIINIIGAAILFLALGFSIAHNKHFPYGVIIQLKEVFVAKKELGRISDTSNYVEVDLKMADSTGVFLTYGQSNSVNQGQIGYEVKEEVFMHFQGKTYEYKDPSLGGSGIDGSVWGMVGDKLINSGAYKRVVFANSGLGGRKLEELNKGKHFDYLVFNYQSLKDKFGKVDAILFHQGESEIEPDNVDNYYKNFEEFISNLKAKGISIPIYLSRASYCYSLNSKITEIQDSLIKEYEIVREGPNTDLLTDKKYRLPDNCHFSMAGYERFSDLWVEYLTD